MLPPIRPVPIPAAIGDKAVGLPFPQIEIPLHGGKYHRDGLKIPRVPVVLPEAIGADAGKRLLGQFHPPTSRDRRIDHPVGPLPCGEFAQPLADDGMGAAAAGVEDLVEDDHLVPPPLRSLAIGVLDGIAHVDVHRVEGFFPEEVEERIVAGKLSDKLRGVAGLAVTQGAHLDSSRGMHLDLMAVKIRGQLPLLESFAGQIFRAKIGFAPAHIIIRAQIDESAGVGREFEPRGHRQIARQVRTMQGASIRLGFRAQSDEVHDAAVAPERRGARHQSAPGRTGRLAAGDGCRPPPVIVGRRFPTREIEAGVEADIGFRKPAVGMRCARIAVGRVTAGLPVPSARKHPIGGFHQQAGLSAAMMAKPIATKIPDEDRHGIVPLSQEGGRVNRIAVGVARGRPTLELPLEDGQLPVDPHPVF